MKLPTIRLRLVPESRCVRCGQAGYVEEKARLCIGCLNISLICFAKRRKEMPDVVPKAKAASAAD